MQAQEAAAELAAHAKRFKDARWAIKNLLKVNLSVKERFKLPAGVGANGLGFDKAGMKKRFTLLSLLVHPDKTPVRDADERHNAEEAFKVLNTLYDSNKEGCAGNAQEERQRSLEKKQAYPSPLHPSALSPKASSFRPKARAPLDCPSMDSPPSGPRSARAFEHGRKKVCCRPSEPPAHAARARHAQNRWVLGPVVGAATGPSTHRAHPAPPAREHRAQPRSSVAHRAAPRASPRASPWARPRCSPCAHLVQASVVGAALPPPPLSSSSSSSSSSTC